MNDKRAWIYDLLLIAVLAVAAWLRVTGVNWGEGQYQHPDEGFLSGVVDNMRAHACKDPAISIDGCPAEEQRWLNPFEYFDTDKSTLNPNNRGAGFYVYGTLPLFLVRYTYELQGPHAGSLKLLGRQFSALADLASILLLYVIVARLYGRRTALLAALFSALTVMQIQQSHFFTVDLFANPFLFLALYFAVRIAYDPPSSAVEMRSGHPAVRFLRDPLLWYSVLFGLALGMAAACKINAIVLAVALPGALALRFVRRPRVDDGGTELPQAPEAERWSRAVVCLLAGGLLTLLAFRVFQPYAFDGLLPNPKWIASLSELSHQPAADLPWNLQWARRTHLYSFTNLTVWGLGLPLGILAWTGFLVMAWRIFKGERRHILLWGWTALYFGWQSLQFNPTMRYQLPVYPLLCMMAAWLIFEIPKFSFRIPHAALRILSAVLGTLVAVLTAAWAVAFLSIYTRPEPRVAASRWIFQNVPGPVTLHFTEGDPRPLPFPYGGSIDPASPYLGSFTPAIDTSLTEIVLPHVKPALGSSVDLTVSVLPQSEASQALAGTQATITNSGRDPQGDALTLTFARPVPLLHGQTYFIKIEAADSVALAGASIANETDYDWTLPFRIDSYDPFGGLYPGDLNLQVYWDDNADKLARFQDVLDQTDYIFIPTNHQYAQITRLPERYPLTTVYYRELIGCPEGTDIIWCYRVAEPGTFQGRLGFDLVQTFESYPTVGPFVINDQTAEEAFTFYDHPKVLIFKKNADYDPNRVRAVLGAVDLTRVVHLMPADAGRYQYKDLMLPADRLAQQRAGGTWSDLFSYDWLQNKFPALGLVFWYVFIFALGLIAYPLARLALPGLGQSSYPLGRIVGMALLAYLCWLGGSLGVPYTRLTIGLVLALLAATGLAAGWMRRDDLRADWNSNRRYYLIVEMLFLAFFVFDLLIRLGNPDLWHPSKGGERPMDFSYFNAVLKSTSFPPYDPWFAGGYINYYYYGFVLVGTPVKLLGIVPTIAYNFILPTLFALVAIGAFTAGSQLLAGMKLPGGESASEDRSSVFNLQLIGGVISAGMMVMLGNLGTLQLLFQRFQAVAAPGGVIEDASFLQRLSWAAQGLLHSFLGASLPIGPGDWYWFPSRVIPSGPGNEITEFPLFTFLYSDLHAHMLVMPLTLFVIAWALSFVRAQARMSRLSWIAAFGMAALFIGALRPTNTWDLYTYFALAAVTIFYTITRYGSWKGRFGLPAWLERAALGIVAAGLLYVLASLLYEPFTHWYSQAYGSLDPWDASRTPVSSYLTHWGLFLFVIFAWLVWETREWMAATPVSALSKLRPAQIWIEAALAVFIVLIVYLAVKHVSIGWFALPLAAWAGVLLLRPGLSDGKRLAFFMIGTGLLLTIVVELYTLRGDIGRQNTIFKIYLQAWTMFAVSAGAGLAWLLVHIPYWLPRWRNSFQIGLSLLLAGAFLFTLTATTDKIRDRMAPQAPHTLDSMTYMDYATHWDVQTMDLSQDYRAIRWMQDNVKGSPVIVEANCTEYRWCTRFTIYTGLPGVVGWNFHQRQQRALLPPNLVPDRVDQVGIFYVTTDIEKARAFLRQYDVHYIVVGQLEHNLYPAEGIRKFEQYEGQYWRAVYRDADTVIYEVIP